MRLPFSLQTVAANDLRDVRVIDSDGRQWPYLRSEGTEPDTLSVPLGRPSVERGSSTYVIDSDAIGELTVGTITLHIDSPYVGREYEVRGIDPSGALNSLMGGDLDRPPGSTAPIELTLRPSRVSRLELVVEDGDETPLEIVSADLQVMSHTLFVAAPPGDYRVLVGNAEASAPEYEIERARRLVMLVRPVDAEAGPAAANPAYVAPAWYAGDGGRTMLLWAVLLLAVLVLGAMTFRLARQASPAAPGRRAARCARDRRGSRAGRALRADGKADRVLATLLIISGTRDTNDTVFFAVNSITVNVSCSLSQRLI